MPKRTAKTKKTTRAHPRRIHKDPHHTSAQILYIDDYRHHPAEENIFEVSKASEEFYFPVTVDEALESRLEDIVTHCEDAISDIRFEALPQKHQSRIWVHLKPAAMSQVVQAIIAGLPSAEMGAMQTHMPV